MPTVEERFWSKVNKNGPLWNGTHCWLWTGSRDKDGYGKLRYGRMTRSHRVAYTLFNMPIPSGLQIDHLCRVSSCVNPNHLEAVTCQENVIRGMGPEVARQRQLVKTHCPKGHPYDDQNTVKKKNKRDCRACINIRGRDDYRKHKRHLSAQYWREYRAKRKWNPSTKTYGSPLSSL